MAKISLVAQAKASKCDLKMYQLYFFLVSSLISLSLSDPEPNLLFNYPNLKDDIYEQPVNLMGSKSPHLKAGDNEAEATADPWGQFDFSKFDDYLNNNKVDGQHNRIKRRAKRRRNRNGKRRSSRVTTYAPEDESSNSTTSRSGRRRYQGNVDAKDTEHQRTRKLKKSDSNRAKRPDYEKYNPALRQMESDFVEMPKDLYQAHLRPGVIFRIHMSEAILKMQYRNYAEDKDESVIEADVEYLRLTRKVISDEITKFEDLIWLVGWFNNRSELVQEHTCNTRYYAVGTPPTLFTHPEEYMKRLCLFDNVYIDHIPYVIGEDNSLMAAVAPPVLHCDAATCTSVPFIDSLMFDERLTRTNVRTVTRCQASCRARCRNDPDCLKRCNDRCLRAK